MRWLEEAGAAGGSCVKRGEGGGDQMSDDDEVGDGSCVLAVRGGAPGFAFSLIFSELSQILCTVVLATAQQVLAMCSHSSSPFITSHFSPKMNDSLLLFFTGVTLGM
jgi:hypothetical protein